ncbi:MAG TPA: alpha/beta hydrolase [Candidatus Margulisiibacteriota bacterium]|nr:alpha/beta hydrolase [Candidatus Margulisiibacteriota bacterium]
MATAQDRRVSARGLSFHYVEWGSARQPPLLCLHGITQTAHSWDEVAADLASDHRVLCFDQRGHGDSDWAPDGDYTRQTQAADLNAITDALDLRQFVLAGMSMGGINSITFTARHLHKVRALIIVDVSPEIQVKGVENIRTFIQAPDELDSFEAFVERAHQFNPRRSLANIRSRLTHNLKQLPNGKWTWKYDKALRSGERSFQASALQNLWDDVRAIRCPTLIIKGGESDILSSESATKLQAAIPGSRLAVVPGAGHSVMGDNPTAFVAAVRPFLSGLAG